MVPGMNDNEGQIAVHMARQAIEAVTRDTDMGAFHAPAGLNEKRGVFVTLSTYPDHNLRGCIGYPEPIFSLAKAILQAAEGACHDPRFPALKEKELDDVVVEVSVLTPPELIKIADRKNLPELVTVGVDGLIMENGPYRGLLLPQVPVEWQWNSVTFLEQTCIKAGLLPDMWLDKSTKVYKFQGEVFAESSPHGPVRRKELV
jgi:uncharacterized protein (TIGR00296 family)